MERETRVAKGDVEMTSATIMEGEFGGEGNGDGHF